MCSDAGGDACLNCFALVSYIPGELGRFLDDLRQELVPSCRFRSHVTVLPPRPIQGEPPDAADRIAKALAAFEPFSLSLEQISSFPCTSVVYLSLGAGRKHLLELHGKLNTRSLSYDEPYPFHPHITLAQYFPVEQLPALQEIAQRRWAEYRGPRSFSVQDFVFVQRTTENQWVHLAECPLGVAEQISSSAA